MNQDEIKNNLELSWQGLNEMNLPIEDGSLLDRIEGPALEIFDRDKVSKRAKEKAIRLMSSIVKLFISKKLVNDEFIMSKVDMSTSSIKSILVSLKQLEYAIDVILRDIGMGESGPRLYEVFGQLQRTKVELIREYTSLVNVFEDSMKRYKMELEFREQETTDVVVDSSKDNIYRGNKQLMMDLKNTIEDADFEEE